MSFITTLTRMWLTRSRKPFTFQSEGDQTLFYDDAEGLGLYVHIPFCQTICTFCPYCKQPYHKDVADHYLDALIKEIHLVGSKSEQKKTVTSLYFGGGTPALIADRLHEIILTIEKYFVITEGIGIELHPDNVTIPILRKLKDAGVTKISIGIQSFQEKYQSILGRHTVDANALHKALSSVKFETVSMDFIFALPSQTKNDLIEDIETAFQIGANHIAIYPFIDFTFTKSHVKPMKNKEKRKLLDEITHYCQQKGLSRDSIWTFSGKDTAH